jgi:hypothetical protein
LIYIIPDRPLPPISLDEIQYPQYRAECLVKTPQECTASLSIAEQGLFRISFQAGFVWLLNPRGQCILRSHDESHNLYHCMCIILQPYCSHSQFLMSELIILSCGRKGLTTSIYNIVSLQGPGLIKIGNISRGASTTIQHGPMNDVFVSKQPSSWEAFPMSLIIPCESMTHWIHSPLGR